MCFVCSERECAHAVSSSRTDLARGALGALCYLNYYHYICDNGKKWLNANGHNYDHLILISGHGTWNFSSTWRWIFLLQNPGYTTVGRESSSRTKEPTIPSSQGQVPWWLCLYMLGVPEQGFPWTLWLIWKINLLNYHVHFVHPPHPHPVFQCCTLINMRGLILITKNYPENLVIEILLYSCYGLVHSPYKDSVGHTVQLCRLVMVIRPPASHQHCLLALLWECPKMILSPTSAFSPVYFNCLNSISKPLWSLMGGT